MIEVTLEHHDDDTLARFGNEITRLPEVVEAFLVTGEYDYLIKVAVAGTEGYEEFLRKRLYKLKGVRHSRSTFVLRRLKHSPRSSRDAWVPSVRRRRAASAQSVQELVDRAVERAWIAQVHAMRRAGDVDAPRLRQPARQRIQHGG